MTIRATFRSSFRASFIALVLPLLLSLTACDQLGIESTAQIDARKDAEGRAVGGACRQSGRALEDCYELNPKALKAAVFAGWRDMDAYMRENKIEIVTPTLAPGTGTSAKGKKVVEDDLADMPPTKAGADTPAADGKAADTAPPVKAAPEQKKTKS